MLPTVDAVLLSHGDLAHLGGLPLAVASGALQAPIVSTLPVQRMGNLALQELMVNMRVSAVPQRTLPAIQAFSDPATCPHHCMQACSDTPPFTAAQVAEAFAPRRWSLTRYYQQREITGRGLLESLRLC